MITIVESLSNHYSALYKNLAILISEQDNIDSKDSNGNTALIIGMNIYNPIDRT